MLLGVEIDQEKELPATRIIRENRSVRVLEKIVEKMKAPPKKKRAQKSNLPLGSSAKPENKPTPKPGQQELF